MSKKSSRVYNIILYINIGRYLGSLFSHFKRQYIYLIYFFKNAVFGFCYMHRVYLLIAKYYDTITYGKEKQATK